MSQNKKSKEAIRQEVIKTIQKQMPDGTQLSEQISDDTKLIQDLGLDSLDNVALMVDLERAFELEIPEEEGEKLDTLGHIVNYIDKAINQA